MGKDPDRFLEVLFCGILFIICTLVFVGILMATIFVPPLITEEFFSSLVRIVGIIFSIFSGGSVLISIIILIIGIMDRKIEISGEGD